MPILYHLSPENFNEFDINKTGSLFNNASNRIGERGVFLAPSYGDALKWVPTIAFIKGRRSRNESKKQQRINRDFENDDREDPVPHPPETQSKYKTLFLYKVEILRPALDKIKRHNKEYNESLTSDNSFMAPLGSWEPELFVPEQFLTDIRIVSVKRFDTQDLLTEYNAVKNRAKSEGYYDYSRPSWIEKKPPQTQEDFDQVFEARKKFDSQYSIGDHVQYEGKDWTISSIEGRFIVLDNWKTKTVDIIEFLSAAKPASEKFEDKSWYNANVRNAYLRRLS